MNLRLNFLILLVLFVFITSKAQTFEKHIRAHLDTLSITEASVEQFIDTVNNNQRTSIDSTDIKEFIFNIEQEHSWLLANDKLRDKFYLIKARYLRDIDDYLAALTALNSIVNVDQHFTVNHHFLYLLLKHTVLVNLNLFSESIPVNKELELFFNEHQLEDEELRFRYTASLAMSYNSMGDYEAAISEAKKYLENYLTQDEVDPHFALNRYNNLGVYYNNANKPDSAILSFKKALQYVDNAPISDNGKPNTYFKALINGNIAESYILQGRYIDAIPLLNKDIALSKKYNRINVVYGYLHLAKAYFEIGDTKAASSSLNAAKNFMSSNRLMLQPRYQNKLFTLESLLEQRLGNLEVANSILRRQIAYNDSVQRVANRSEALALQTAFEIEKKEKALIDAKLREKNIESTLSTRNSFIIAAILLLSGLLILVFIYQRSNRKQRLLAISFQRLNETIAEKNKTIAASLTEKETLLKEIHHRVKNNLQVISSLLNLQSKMISDDKVSKALQEGQTRVRSMALVHQKLYETDNYKDIEIKDYLSQLVENLIATYNKAATTKYNIISSEVLDIDLAVPIGLIANEAVTNSLKYFKGADVLLLNITLKQINNEHYVLDISDNGPGFEVNTVLKKSTLGLKLIKILVAQLEGELDIISSEVDGTLLNITFPKPQV